MLLIFLLLLLDRIVFRVRAHLDRRAHQPVHTAKTQRILSRISVGK
jgi:hypothetical protein